MKVITFGGIITSLRLPDRDGKPDDVIVGVDQLADFETRSPYFGAIIGRYGNRIANSRFTLEGKAYTLAANDGVHSLHGGAIGFNKRVWEAKPVQGDHKVSLELSYFSPDGEEGYPGNLPVKALYTLTDDNELVVDYTATTDKTTVLNMTHHAYFNLAGTGSGTVEHEILTIYANQFSVTGAGLIPTGEIAPVADTPLDFRAPKKIGADLRTAHPQMVEGRGYDHNFVLNRADDGSLTLAASVYDPVSGRTLDVLTTEPCIQLYTGNFLNGTLPGKYGKLIRQGDGLCLEPQHFPNSPNQPGVPSTLLRPGETYRWTSVYRFGVR